MSTIAAGQDRAARATNDTVAPTVVNEADVRTWTDSTGKFSVKATLVRYTTEEVHLQKADGTTVVVPIARLSDADQSYVRVTAIRATRPTNAKLTGRTGTLTDKASGLTIAVNISIAEGKLLVEKNIEKPLPVWVETEKGKAVETSIRIPPKNIKPLLELLGEARSARYIGCVAFAAIPVTAIKEYPLLYDACKLMTTKPNEVDIFFDLKEAECIIVEATGNVQYLKKSPPKK
jgi:hypothetical protein